MIAVDFNPEKLTGADADWWSRWLEEAHAASELTCMEVEGGKAVNEVIFPEKEWRELKTWLLDNVFHGKCAYCESTTGVTDYSTADHYRPKGRVGDEASHSGYYWVAYDWRNLLPCCIFCNTLAKRDNFPIAGRRVFLSKEASSTFDLNLIEAPLLLSPYESGDGNPRNHLEFNKFGQIIPRNGSLRGRRSLEICDLTRSKLKDQRAVKQEWARLKFKYLSSDVRLDSELQLFIHEIEAGEFEYSAAIADEIDRIMEENYRRTKSLRKMVNRLKVR